jgi:hypothetical protein
MKIRALVTAALLATTVVSAPASANIPVIDPTAIARLRETVSVATKQLGALQQQVQAAQQMRNTIGQVGPGMLGNILQQSGLDFSGERGVLNSITSLKSQADDTMSQVKGLKMSGERMSFGNITNLSSGREAASQIFFYNGSDAMTPQLVTQLRTRRQAVVRDAAVTSYGTASAMKGDMIKTQQIADGLSTQAKASTDLRGDVQANTAAMLAVYGEVSKQTAIAAQMLELQSAQTLSVDSTGKRGN